MELLRQVIGLEYQALALAAGPLASMTTGWGLRQVMLHLRDRRAAGYVTRLVAWAEQAIPDRSARYHEVAALLSRRFPMLSGEQMEVLIESEVLGLKTALRAGQRLLASGAAGALGIAVAGAGAAASEGPQARSDAPGPAPAGPALAGDRAVVAPPGTASEPAPMGLRM